jgi:hypothetical protein
LKGLMDFEARFHYARAPAGAGSKPVKGIGAQTGGP